MVRKVTLCGISLLFLGVILADYFNPIIGAFICSVITFLLSRNQLLTWLTEISQKLEKVSIRHPRRRRKRVIIVTSGNLLPWVEKLTTLFRLQKTKLGHEASSLDLGINVSSDSYHASFSQSENAKFCGAQAMASEEIKSFVHNISKDFIQSWYKNLSNNDEFVGDLDYILEDVFIAICERLSRMNISQLAHRILMVVFNHFLFIKKSAGKQSIRERLHGTNFKIFHPAMKDEKAAYMYLLSVCEILIDIVGPPDLLLCAAVRAFLIDILTKTLWLPLLQLLAEPERIYSMIIYLITDTDFEEDYSHTSSILSSDFLEPDPFPDPIIVSVSEKSGPVIIMDDSDPMRIGMKATRPKTLNTVRKNLTPKKHSMVPQISICAAHTTVQPHGCLSKTKSVSLETLYDSCSESLVPRLSKEFSHSTTQLEDLANASPVSCGEEAICSSSEGKSSPIDFKPFSLFPAEGLEVERTSPANFDLLPNPIRNRLPKKLSFRERIRPSKSLDMLAQSSNSLPANMRFATSVFHNLASTKERVSSTEEELNLKKLQKSSVSADVEQAEEVMEFESISPFLRVCITGTREQLDPKHKIYILYCIKVEYIELLSVLGDRQRVVRTGSADRRFKEFIALQSKLEHLETRLKKHMKGIVGPTKFLTMHISPKDKKNIEKRRIFLQKYLQELCSREAIFKNHDLQLFLGIQGDPRLEFVQNAPDFASIPLLLGLGKVMQPVKEVITKLTMPGQCSENGNGDIFQGLANERSPTQSRSYLPSFGKSKQEAKIPSLNYKYKKLSGLEQSIYNFLDRFDVLSSSPEVSRSSSPSSASAVFTRPFELSIAIPRWENIASELRNTPCGPRPQGDGCDSPESPNPEIMDSFLKFNNLQDCLSNEVPHANTLIDIIICLLVPNSAFSSDYMTVMLKVVFGDIIQCWLQKNLKEMTSQENCIHYLHLLHSKLWPIKSESRPIVTANQYKAALLEILNESFPRILRYMLGESELKGNLKFVLDSMGDPFQNRNLLYQIIDVFMEMICTQELKDCSM